MSQRVINVILAIGFVVVFVVAVFSLVSQPEAIVPEPAATPDLRPQQTVVAQMREQMATSEAANAHALDAAATAVANSQISAESTATFAEEQLATAQAYATAGANARATANVALEQANQPTMTPIPRDTPQPDNGTPEPTTAGDGNLRGFGLNLAIIEGNEGVCSDIPFVEDETCSGELEAVLREMLPGANIRHFGDCGSGFTGSSWDAATYDLQIGDNINAGPDCADAADVPVEVAWYTSNSPEDAQALFDGIIPANMRVRTKGEEGSSQDVAAMVISGLEEEGLLSTSE